VSASIFTGDTGVGVIAIIAVVAVIAMILLSRLIKRDQDVRSTKFGWYIERERYSDKPESWPEFQTPPPQRTLPNWPDRDKTAELPPEEAK
jgi:hypothetical protein